MSTPDHLHFMRLALAEAKKSPPKPSNFCVGAVLVDASSGTVLETGYTLEMPGNTHAEQSCLLKLADKYGVKEEELSGVDGLPRTLALYTTMEPCSFRLSGNLPCVDRVLRLSGRSVSDKDATETPSVTSANPRDVTVYCGVTEPDKFVAENTGRKTLENAGIKVVHVPGLEEEILAVATAGHKRE